MLFKNEEIVSENESTFSMDHGKQLKKIYFELSSGLL